MKSSSLPQYENTVTPTVPGKPRRSSDTPAPPSASGLQALMMMTSQSNSALPGSRRCSESTGTEPHPLPTPAALQKQVSQPSNKGCALPPSSPSNATASPPNVPAWRKNNMQSPPNRSAESTSTARFQWRYDVPRNTSERNQSTVYSAHIMGRYRKP